MGDQDSNKVCAISIYEIGRHTYAHPLRQSTTVHLNILFVLMIINVNYKVTNYDKILPVCVWVLHKLEIESGRFHIIPRENKLCKLCQQGVVESEFHCLLCCNHYHTLRDKYCW